MKKVNYVDVYETLGKIRNCLILKDSKRCSRNCDMCKLNIPTLDKIQVCNYLVVIMQELAPILVANEKPKKRKTTKKREDNNEANKKTNKVSERISSKEKERD